MKKWIVYILILTVSVTFAQDYAEEHSNKYTQIDSPQPYFKVLNKDAEIDQIPLLMTAVDVLISGTVAEVEVTQYYKNDGNVPLEAQYVFPGSVNAAVYHLDMKIGDRVIDAKVATKAKAKETYDVAKSAGKTASLLEQGDPGLFTMNVANILPNDDIKVSLKYTEKIIPSRGKYRFIYPAVGRPSVLANGNEALTTYAPGKNMGFDLSVTILSPLAINSFNSINHSVVSESAHANHLTVLLDPKESLNFTDDFIIDYDLRGSQINTGAAIYEEGDDGYFLLMLQPPSSFKPKDIVPKEYIFVVDSSGSMENEPIENAKFIASSLMTDLSENEYFNVVLFAGDADILSEQSVQATDNNVNLGLEMVNVKHAGGGTDLKSALIKINATPKIEGVSRSLIILTDGAISVPDRTIDLLRNTPDQNVFVIGVSGGYGNDNAAINAIAKAGQGLSFYATGDEDMNELQSQFLDYVRYPLLTDIAVQPMGFESIDIFPRQIVDLFAEKPLFLTGKYSTNQRGSIEVTGQGNGNKYKHFVDLDGLAHSANNESIKYLWAKEKITDLSFDTFKNEPEITQLGLRHNLLTEYTSFVAVDQLIRSDGSMEKVKHAPRVPSVSGYGYAESPLKIQTKYAANVKPKWLAKQLPTVLEQPKLSAKDRQNITFIMGKDSSDTNLFYQTASLLYQSHENHKTDLIVDHLRDISAVKNYLKTNANPTKPWGLINIVSHSSPWSGLSNNSEDENNQSLNLFSINEMITDKNFTPLNNETIDAFSEIRLVGCALGKQSNMLKALSVYFGGQDHQRPVVKAPIKHVYMNHDKIDKAGNIYSYAVPWFITEKPDFNLSLSEQYGIDATQWKPQPIEISFVIPNGRFADKKHIDKLLTKQALLHEFLADLGVNTNHFKWNLVPSTHHSSLLTGTAYLITTDISAVSLEQLELLDFNDSELVSITQ